MKIVTPTTKFTFKGLCPYCSGDLVYEATGWDRHPSKTFWKVTELQSTCSNEPNIDSDEWEHWFQLHSDMPYVHQLPVDEKVKDFINRTYRIRF
jgi:hypothetical protein